MPSGKGDRSSMSRIAIVGMACRYPDARTPRELWENVLAGRRAFRRLPPERLRLADYFAADRAAPDRTYATRAALIEGYEFDRLKYRVSGEAYRAADQAYKAPFPAPREDTLAGGLSNTIAGRVCNQFHLQGGGYTVDGACASSLLAVATACAALAVGDLDAALAGGVDLSLDPFELVGFAKAGALAQEAMRVYDARSAGFWPGEGCGVVVLMRLADALAQGR